MELSLAIRPSSSEFEAVGHVFFGFPFWVGVLLAPTMVGAVYAANRLNPWRTNQVMMPSLYQLRIIRRVEVVTARFPTFG